jgi:prepilin-type N-terminal cleavage/methylation domain-containing protein
MKKKIIHNKAFTLIELLVVVAIVSLLSALILNSLTTARMKANDTKIVQDLRQFRIAAELYYNDNHVYPEVPSQPQTSFNYQNQTSWSNKLSFFIKTVEAAATHKTPLCKNFDLMAESMVAKKYLSYVPVHPYDDDVAGICYKAVKTEKTFASYGSLTARINVSGGVTSKRTGFIVGDTSPDALSELGEVIIDPDNSIEGVLELAYPMDEFGDVASDLSDSADAIEGITEGSSDFAGGIGDIINDVIDTPGLTPEEYENMSCFNDICACNDGYAFLLDGNENTVNGTCNVVPVMYTLTVNTGYVSPGYLMTLTYDRIGGNLFSSPQSFASGKSVSVYAAIYNGTLYKQPNFSGCDSIQGLTNCNVIMNGDRTITVSE